MSGRIIGVGRLGAGDDGVGIAVIRALRQMVVGRWVELFEAEEPTALLPWLDTEEPVVIVDAVVGGGAVGDVMALDPVELGAPNRPTPVSSHGIDVLGAIRLARILCQRDAPPSIALVGINIRPPTGVSWGLSPDIEGAVPRAAVAALKRLAELDAAAR